jgi:hypothetical protein
MKINSYDVSEHYSKVDVYGEQIHIVTLVSGFVGIGATKEEAYNDSMNQEIQEALHTIVKSPELKAISFDRSESGMFVIYDFADAMDLKSIKIKSVGSPQLRDVEIDMAINLACEVKEIEKQKARDKAQARDKAKAQAKAKAKAQAKSENKAQVKFAFSKLDNISKFRNVKGQELTHKEVFDMFNLSPIEEEKKSGGCNNPNCACKKKKKKAYSSGKYGEIFESYINRIPGIKSLEHTPDDNVVCTLVNGFVGKSVRHPKDKFDVDLGVLWAYINANTQPLN